MQVQKKKSQKQKSHTFQKKIKSKSAAQGVSIFIFHSGCENMAQGIQYAKGVGKTGPDLSSTEQCCPSHKPQKYLEMNRNFSNLYLLPFFQGIRYQVGSHVKQIAGYWRDLTQSSSLTKARLSNTVHRVNFKNDQGIPKFRILTISWRYMTSK